MQLINFNLMKQPINWATIVLMLLLAAIGGHLVLSYFGIEPATSDDSSSS